VKASTRKLVVRFSKVQDRLGMLFKISRLVKHTQEVIELQKVSDSKGETTTILLTANRADAWPSLTRLDQ